MDMAKEIKDVIIIAIGDSSQSEYDLSALSVENLKADIESVQAANAKLAGAAEPMIKVGNLDAQRDMTDVRDMARAYAGLMKKGTPSTIYNVASGVARSMKSILAALVARARVTVSIETDPALLRPSDTPVLLGDATRLRNATGWRPQIPFERTLDDLLNYWRSVTHS
jgi:nucleoside-diphosphate-sugar epimerase